MKCVRVHRYFRNKADVRRHLQEQHSGVQFQCRLCGYYFHQRNIGHACNATEDDMEYADPITGEYGDACKNKLRSFIRKEQDNYWKFFECTADLPESPFPDRRSEVRKVDPPIEPKARKRRPRSPEPLNSPESIILEEPPKKKQQLDLLLKDLSCTPSSTSSCSTSSAMESESDEISKVVKDTNNNADIVRNIVKTTETVQKKLNRDKQDKDQKEKKTVKESEKGQDKRVEKDEISEREKQKANVEIKNSGKGHVRKEGEKQKGKDEAKNLDKRCERMEGEKQKVNVEMKDSSKGCVRKEGEKQKAKVEIKTSGKGCVRKEGEKQKGKVEIKDSGKICEKKESEKQNRKVEGKHLSNGDKTKERKEQKGNAKSESKEKETIVTEKEKGIENDEDVTVKEKGHENNEMIVDENENEITDNQEMEKAENESGKETESGNDISVEMGKQINLMVNVRENETENQIDSGVMNKENEENGNATKESGMVIIPDRNTNSSNKKKITMKEYVARRDENQDNSKIVAEIMKEMTNTYESMLPVVQPIEDIPSPLQASVSDLETLNAVASISGIDINEERDEFNDTMTDHVIDNIPEMVHEVEVEKVNEIENYMKTRIQKAGVMSNERNDVDEEDISVLEKLEYLNMIQDDRVLLNVGGYKFETSRQTLKNDPKSLLARLPPGHSVFLDRDGAHFRLILNYLRSNCQLENPSILPRERKYLFELKTESKYYHLTGLTKIIDNRLKQIEGLYGLC